MMTRSWLVVAALAVGIAAGGAQAAQGESGQQQKVKPDGRGDRTRQMPPRARAVPSGAAGTNGIDYNGGAVLLGTVNMYYIWYGNWGGSYATAVTTLTNLAQNIGGSPYFNINTTYYDVVNGNTNYVSNSVHYAGSTTDSYSQGTSLNDGSIYTIVSNAITSGKLPNDSNGVYFVLTSPDVTETTGFCTQYCGWHTYNGNIKYSFVGNAITQCPFNCATQQPGPNGSDGADGMASVISHELEETTTDPDLNAWFNDLTGEENADQCAWNFGPVQIATNSAQYNMTFGALQYLIQQNWVNALGGYCAQSWTSQPDFTIGGSPSSQSVLQGTSGQYTVTIGALDGYTGNVTLSVTGGLPAGATASFGTNPVVNSGSSTMTISTTGSTPAGNYTITIQGSDGTLTHTSTVGLTVTVPDFSLSASPSSQSVVAGGTTGNYSVTVTPSNGFTGNVTFGVVTGLPSGATATLLNAVNGGSGSSTFTVTTSGTTPAGTYTLTISGSSGALNHSTTTKLVVSAPVADFTISATPSSRTVIRPASTTYTVTIGSLSGFGGSVSLSVSGLPSRSTASFNPSSVAGSGGSTLTITTNSRTATGTRTLTITGANGRKLKHSTTVSLTVN